MENRDEAEQAKTAARFTVPPTGYVGSLAGTPWDPDVMLADFKVAEAQFNAVGGG